MTNGVWGTGVAERGRTANVAKITFPSFVQERVSSPEMRQLVSALELRFQSLEMPTESLFVTQEENFSLIGHTHTESEITNLQDYLTDISGESIFSLADVSGSPSNGYILQWNNIAAEFQVVPPSSSSFALNDLTDVTVPSPVDGQVLTYNDTSKVWEAAGTGASITSFAALSDTDLTGQAQYDLVFNATGSEWQHTNGELVWNPAQDYLQLANTHSINWLDAVGATFEMLILESTAGDEAPDTDPDIGSVVLLVSAEGASGSSFTADIGGGFTGIEAAGGVTEISTAQVKFGDNSLRCNDATGPTEAYWEADAVSADFGFGTGDFTIEFHAYFPAAATNQPFMGIWDFGTDRSWNISMNTNTLGDFRTTFGWSANGTGSLGGASHLWGSGALDTWYHIAITREGTLIKLWVDGVNVGANQTIGATSIHTSTTIELILQGHRNDGFTVESFVDNVRITKGVARYTTTFTPPTKPYDGSGGVFATEQFIVGDPTIETVIDGSTVDINGVSGVSIADYAFDVTQTVGAGQDNYVLTYDDAGGLISLEEAFAWTTENRVLTDINTATPPTTEAVTGFFEIRDNEDVDPLARLGFTVAGNDLYLNNLMRGGDINISYLTSGGAQRFLLASSPSSNTTLRSQLNFSLFVGNSELAINALDNSYVLLHHDAVGTARTAALADGGWVVQNNYNGSAGFERTLSLADITQGQNTLRYIFSTGIGGGDPGDQHCEFDTGTAADVAQVNFDDLMALDHDGEWMFPLLANGDLLTFKNEVTESEVIILRVTGAATDQTGYWTLPVSYVSGAIPTDTSLVRIIWQQFSEIVGPFDTPAVSANAVTLTYSNGPDFEVDMEPATATVAVTISGGPATSNYGRVKAKFQQDGTSAQTLTWAGGTFRWDGGTAHPMNTTLDGFSLYTFETWDGGTIWYGAGADFS